MLLNASFGESQLWRVLLHSVPAFGLPMGIWLWEQDAALGGRGPLPDPEEASYPLSRFEEVHNQVWELSLYISLDKRWRTLLPAKNLVRTESAAQWLQNAGWLTVDCWEGTRGTWVVGILKKRVQHFVAGSTYKYVITTLCSCDLLWIILVAEGCSCSTNRIVFEKTNNKLNPVKEPVGFHLPPFSLSLLRRNQSYLSWSQHSCRSKERPAISVCKIL